MSDEQQLPPIDPARMITAPRRAWFLFARPTENTDELPANIGERDVFATEDAALDALDLHYAWALATNAGNTSVARTAQWYLQSAMVGPKVSAALGDVYLASRDDESGDTWAVAGGFLTEGELIHWSSFVHAVSPYIPLTATTSSLGLAYRGDVTTHFHQLWFAPLRSRRVYPKKIVVDEESAG